MEESGIKLIVNHIAVTGDEFEEEEEEEREDAEHGGIRTESWSFFLPGDAKEPGSFHDKGNGMVYTGII